MDLPPVETFEQIAAALSLIFQAVATGQISSVEGAQLGNLLHLQHDVLKHADIESRIQLLEKIFDPELRAAKEEEVHRKVVEA